MVKISQRPRTAKPSPDKAGSPIPGSSTRAITRARSFWCYVFISSLVVILSSIYVVQMKQAMDDLQDKQQRTEAVLLSSIAELKSSKESVSDNGVLPEIFPPKVKNRHERRLSSLGNIAAYASATINSGCVTVDLAAASGDITIDLATTACGGGTAVRCPPCFIVADGHATRKLVLSNVATMKITPSVSLGSSSTAFENSLSSFTFVNADTSTIAIISDGSTDTILGPSSYLEAFAYSTGASDILFFPSNYFNSGLHTGTGYSGTGSTLTGAGALSLDGAAILNGGTTFSGGGHVAASGTTNIDLSGSAGTFLTPTGAVTIGTGTVTISGAATHSSTTRFSGHVDSSGTTNIDLSGSAGTFLTPTGAVTIGTGAIGISGASTFSNNMATSGSATVDFSGSTGVCTVANPWVVR